MNFIVVPLDLIRYGNISVNHTRIKIFSLCLIKIQSARSALKTIGTLYACLSQKKKKKKKRNSRCQVIRVTLQFKKTQCIIVLRTK